MSERILRWFGDRRNMTVLEMTHNHLDLTAQAVRELYEMVRSVGDAPESKKEFYERISEMEMKADQIARTREHLDRGMGYMCASTWLQCVAPHGPNLRPGGMGGKDDPGIRWWLEFVRKRYGAYEAPPVPGKNATNKQAR